MPYEGEFAHHRSVSRIAGNPQVQALLSKCKVRMGPGSAQVTQLRTVPAGMSFWRPDLIIAVDGSHIEIPLRNGFPGAEASYVTVASVILDVAKMRELDQSRPVDPKAMRSVESAASIDQALPGCNMILDGYGSAKESLRRVLFDLFGSVRLFEGAETLLDTYEAILANKPTGAKPQGCPYDDCPKADAAYRPSPGTYPCACQRTRQLYSTDALRIHEGMQDSGSNGALFAEVMQVLERLWIVHVLRGLEQRKWLSSLKRVALVLDGPLAVFGHPAWLAPAISTELQRLNEVVRRATGGQDLLLIGIEKTGPAVDHFEALDTNERGATGVFPPQTAGLLSDAYIKRNIIFSDSDKAYGKDTYFGRKFFYKTASGARVVATTPFLAAGHDNVRKADPDQFPRLMDILPLLDDLVSTRYPNALQPLVAAHAEAAIPLNLGKRVLEDLARRLMGEAR